jgi:hypothetical protein
MTGKYKVVMSYVGIGPFDEWDSDKVLDEFSQEVSIAMEEGWKLAGGISVAIVGDDDEGDDIYYHQALYRE